MFELGTLLIATVVLIVAIGQLGGFFSELENYEGPTAPLSFKQAWNTSKLLCVYSYWGKSLGRKTRVRFAHRNVT